MVEELGVRDVEKLLQMSRGEIRRLIDAGFVSPKRGARRAFRFSFQDLILLRTAQALSAAQVPPRRIARSLKQLRRRLPASVPLSGLRICAVGDRVVVMEGGERWQADTGQYLLALDVQQSNGALTMLARAADRSDVDPEEWFRRGVELERVDRAAAQDAYERALAQDSTNLGARINLGCLLHEAGQHERAEAVYRQGVAEGEHDAVLLFNLAVLMEDVDRRAEAIELYQRALRQNPGFADCHYNLALAFEAAGDERAAIRHMREYRKLSRVRS